MKRKIYLLIPILFIFSMDSYGYIDPGTGSYLVQVIIAVIAGAALGLKLFWKKIKLLFSHLFSKSNKID